MFGYFTNIQIFRKFLLSYILILIMPLAASFIVYQVSINRIKDNAAENSKDLLNQTISIIDKKIDDTENFVYQMSLNPEVNQLMYQESKTDKNYAYNIYKVRNSIYPYWSTNTFFRNFYLYFNQIDTIVTPESSYVRPKDYYLGHSYEGMGYDEWNNKINQAYLSHHYFSSAIANTGKNTESVITYVQSIPFNSTANPKANVVVMIDEKEITSLLDRISSQYGGSVFVYDDQKNIILTNNVDERMLSYDGSSNTFSINNNDKKFIYIDAKSSRNQWTYVAALSKQKLSEDVSYIQTFNFLASIVTIIVGLAIALLFSYRHSIPLNRLLGIMRFSETRSIDPYEFLNSNVEDIIANNDSLKNQIQSQLPILQDTVIRKLVFEELTSSKEALKLIEQANIPIRGAFGYVGIVQIIHLLNAMDKEMMDEMNVAQLFIHNELTDAFHGEVLYSNVDVDQVVFLLSYPKQPSLQEEEALRETLALLVKRMEENYSLKVNIGLGQGFKQITDIHKSYDQAAMSLPFIQSMNQQPSLYKYVDHFKERNIDYYYPIELEIRLINAAANGDTRDVHEMLDKVYIENVEYRVLTPQIGNQLLASLNGTLLRILAKASQLNQVVIDDISAGIEEMMSRKNDFINGLGQIREGFTKITLHIHERKFVAGKQVIQEMKEWIKQNFHVPDLTLHQIAEAIGFPEKMVPLIFKEHVGVNISDYIEDMRINFAKAKLTQTGDSIEEIALQSGYNSAHSFRRAFKRNTGASPSEFQKMMKNL